MLLFSLSFFLSLSCLLWVALFNNVCRDLPPSRALAIAQGRLDPISMCAFNGLALKEPSSPQHTLQEAKSTCRDELARKEPSSPQHTLKEAKSTCGDSCDHPSSHKLMQGDVWLGTDDLITSLAASKPELLSLSPLPISACTLPLNVWPDNGFIAHLASISNIEAVVRPPLDLEEQQPPACNSSLVTLSPGKKRVLPPPPNNNPFKRGKRADESFSLSSKAQIFFDTELDGKLFCRDVEKAICVPHEASHKAGQFSCIKHEAQWSIVTEGSVDIKAGGNLSLMSLKVGSFQDTSKSTTLTPLHVQDSEESLGDIDSSTGGAQVLIEAEGARDTQVSMQSKVKTLASLQADSSDIKPVRGQHTFNSKACMHPEPQASISPVYQDSVVQQYSSEVCAVSTSHSMLPTSASHHMKAGTDSSKTPTVTKQLQREAKAKKEIRSSLKQSSKEVIAASTPSLLKFFQRAPTL